MRIDTCPLTYTSQGFFRSALVFSPSKDLTDSVTVIDIICKSFQKSSYPFPEASVVAGRLFRVCKSTDGSDTEARRCASAVLRKLAMQWEDPGAWSKALSVCPQGTVLQNIGVQGFVQAYRVFKVQFLQATKPL